MHPSGPPGLPCPVCGTPATGQAAAPCPGCGLPAVGQAALVVARIGATLTELTRDRDALLATLRASAPGPGAPPVATPVAPPAAYAPAPPAAFDPPAPRRRLSPQQVLLALGAVLLVAGAVAFVALAWTRLGLAFQATVMVVVTAAACGASAFAARRGLRATEEALAGAGAALLAVDLAAAYGKGLLGIDALPLRLWAAIACGTVVLFAVGLGRLSRTTCTWPLVALLAAQPMPFLLMTPHVLAGPAGVAAAIALALLDVAAALRLRRGVAAVAWVLAAGWTTAGAVGGVTAAALRPPLASWLSTAVVVAAAVGAVLLLRVPRIAAHLPARWLVAAVGGGVAGLALAGSLDTAGEPGRVVAGALAVVMLTAAVALVRLPWLAAALGSAGASVGLVACARLADTHRPLPLSLVLLALAVPAALAVVLRPAIRQVAAAVVILAPGAALLVAEDGGLLPATTAGLLLAVLAAAGFGLATVGARGADETPFAGAATLAAALAGATSATVGAWGQVGLQLAVAGAAAAGYAVVTGRRWVLAVAIGDLVLASWIAVGGARVETPEAYTLPAAVGLLLIGLPRLLDLGRSWAAEGPAIAVGLVPSAFLAVTEPSTLRLVLVVAVAAVLTVAGTLGHRQAPFVLGAASLAFVALGRLGPYAPLLPRWVALTAAGLLLLLLGATYERRRQQAREAVAWVVQMH